MNGPTLALIAFIIGAVWAAHRRDWPLTFVAAGLAVIVLNSQTPIHL